MVLRILRRVTQLLHTPKSPESVLRIRIGFNAHPDTNPDPAFFCQCESRYGSGSRSRSKVLITKDWNKFTAEKKIIFIWSNIAFYLSLGLHKGRPSYMRSLHPSKENISHFKITWIFFPFVGLFGPPDPDPVDQNECRYVLIRISNTAQKSTNSWLERSLISEWYAHHAAVLGVHLVALSTLPASLGARSGADIGTRLQSINQSIDARHRAAIYQKIYQSIKWSFSAYLEPQNKLESTLRDSDLPLIYGNHLTVFGNISETSDTKIGCSFHH